jgi:hypothetical protein
VSAQTEWEVPGVGENSSGSVKVRRDGDEVVVQWFCGDSRRFAPDTLRAAIQNVERTRSFPGVDLSDVDSGQRRFSVRLGGEDAAIFYADDFRDGVVGDNARAVEWPVLLAALKKALVKPRRPSIRKPKS